ncbi:MAG TPA: ABC transporter ATP-binding protein [Bryobacteraceae bacterium]|nr:ABC transporter ATP-binding protein [Bryobacteraceae bacterium]
MKELKRLLSYSRRYLVQLTAAVILMAAAGATQGLLALLIGPIFDRVLNPAAPNTRVPLLSKPFLGHQLFLDQIVPDRISNVWTAVAFAILMVFLTKGICDYVGNYLISYSGFAAVTDLRNRVFDKVMRQGAEFFEQNSAGRLMSSIMNDVDKVQVAVSQILADLFRQFFTAIFLTLVVMSKDWKLALVSVTILPFVVIPTTRIGRRIRRTSRRTQERQAELTQILEEAIGGHMVVKAFGAEEYESRRFREAARNLFRTNVRYVLQQALSSPLIEMFGAITIVALLTYARDQIKAHQLTPGDFTSFVIALLMLYEPVKRLVGIHNIFEQALGASQKVFEHLDHVEEIVEKPGAHALTAFRDSVRFENITFHYPGSPKGFHITGLDLEVKAGQIVALVGPSGAGKTSLANLAPRFYDVAAGAVRIDGHDIRDVNLASLRGLIGIVAQDTFLFNDTAANNIAYGRPGTPLADIQRAAEAALADEFIRKLPQGYDTILGDRGLKLSGGQRQRIAIARALLKNAPILILDEATSHLDTESEILVQKALANLMRDRTVIVIAHRLSTIRRADKIVVLSKGRVRETGTHEELVRQGGLYQRLYELQFESAGTVVDG